jgi:hypothetical protein
MILTLKERFVSNELMAEKINSCFFSGIYLGMKYIERRQLCMQKFSQA